MKLDWSSLPTCGVKSRLHGLGEVLCVLCKTVLALFNGSVQEAYEGSDHYSLVFLRDQHLAVDSASI